MTSKKVIIVGSGPAGYSAAIYLARAKFEPLMISGDDIGGQPMWTSEIENYAGFKDGIDGKKLMIEMKEQAEKFGTEVIYEKVINADLSRVREFRLKTSSGDYESESIVIATGSKSIRLNLANEDKFFGRGISVCAVCDAAFFQDKTVFVVGGGDTAIEDSLALTKFAQRVNLIVRRDRLRASKYMQEKIKQNKQINIWWNHEVIKLVGDYRLSKLILVNNKTNEEIETEADGLFYAIGRKPNSHLFNNQIKIDENGYIMTSLYYQGNQIEKSNYLMMTSLPGVFAAGDVVDMKYRQVSVAVGMGAMAALDCERWLEDR